MRIYVTQHNNPRSNPSIPKERESQTKKRDNHITPNKKHTIMLLIVRFEAKTKPNCKYVKHQIQ